MPKDRSGSIHLTVCFEAGRFTLTQSSWTTSARRCSRKWMSGHAGKALVLISGRGQSKTRTLCSLGEPASRGQGESPFPLDHYLSWMTTKSPGGYIFKHGAMAGSLDKRYLAGVSCRGGNGECVSLDQPVHAYGPAFGHTGVCLCFGRVDGQAIGSSERRPTSQTAPGYKTIRS